MKRPAGLFLLLLALFLPLQGFALAAACDAPAVPGVAEHCAGHPGTPAHATHHECGSCCCLAVSTAATPLLPGRTLTAGALPAPPLATHPTLLLDRLDRPPRG